MGPFKEAQLYRESVILCIADPETSDEINAFSVNDYEIRKFMRRLQVKAVSDIVPRILELCSESNFQNEYIQYTTHSKKWTDEHKGLDFEHYWEMIYRFCHIAQQGYVEY